jgi:uncharacterized protein YybS (DUF2232 family)
MKWQSLISEEVTGQWQVSLGRVSFWIVLVILCIMWCQQTAIPDTLFWTWMTLVGYNLAKKPLNIASTYLNFKKMKEEVANLEKFFN